MTAGGCTGCLTLGDDATAGLRLEHSRFDDLELAAGCEAAAVNGIARGFAHSGRAFCGLMGSAIPELLGMDYTGIQESLAERGSRYSGSPAPDLSPHQWAWTGPCGIWPLEAPGGA
ncbi:MAG: hypothetical protein ACLRNQ_21310 [Flavonifractor plautii]